MYTIPFVMSDYTTFTTNLLSWYSVHKRDLPWRKTTDPYKIMISEFMSQQTQISRVVPKYHAFLDTFPGITDLANGKLSDVIALWSGLGYNRRAKFLFESAKYVVFDLDGDFPKTPESLVELPGFGPYTAGAVCAFAFNYPSLVVDANVKNVFNRIFGLTEKEIPSAVKKCLPKDNARDFYNALMDLGSKYFSRGATFDSEYPFKKFCKTYNGKSVPSLKKVKQKTFVGSNRFYRGQIMKMLVDTKELLIADLQSFDESEKYLIAKNQLLSEGLILEDSKRIYLKE